jgi:hypothetical protein
MHKRRLSCTAANARSLTRKALGFYLERRFLRLQHFFSQNWLKPAVSSEMHIFPLSLAVIIFVQ